MGEVVTFRKPSSAAPGESAEEDEEGVHLSGAAVCLSCAHKWAAVVPEGTPVNAPPDTLGLTCPACGSMKGVLQKFSFYTDVPNYTCTRCESFMFSIILAKGDVPCVSCACCGHLINALDLFNHKEK